MGVGLLVGTLALAACTAGQDTPDDDADGAASGSPQGSASPGPGEYLPGLAATVDRPPGAPTAVVVLVPGGSWRSADPNALGPLAAHLVEGDLAVVTITYGTSGTGAYYPRPADDVACAVGFAAQEVPDVPVVLAGHSAGGQLVALVGLRPDRDDATCPYPTHSADAVVGLAGPYDVSDTDGFAQNLFGASVAEDPAAWRDGNPVTWASERPEVPYLLVHGEADRDVPMSFTDDFAATLTDGGHDVTVERLPDVTHVSLVTPEVVGDFLVDWVTEVARG